MALRRVPSSRRKPRKVNMENDSDKTEGVITSPPATGSADCAERFWGVFGMAALSVTLACIITGNGNSAIAASIVFATSIYGYEHRT